MGDSRVELLLRTTTPIDDIATLAPFEDWLAEDTSLPGNWWRCSYDCYPDQDRLLSDLVADINAPAILGHVMDSDSTLITAAAPGLPETNLGLGLTMLQRRAGETAATLADWAVQSPAQALTYLTTWSTLAGLTPDTTALSAALHYDGVLAGEQWQPLLISLGLPVE